MPLPAICEEMRLHFQSDGIPLANSRDIAEFFEKRHADVLRDIDAILTNANLRSLNWFRATHYLDPKNETRPSFDLTRQGYTILVMGYTGERAMPFKIRYIQAFDAMEAELRAGTRTVSTDQLISAIREIVAPLAVRFDGQDTAIEEVRTEVEDLKEEVVPRLVRIESKLFNQRRKITETTKIEHIYAINQLGGRCPCGCARVIVVDGEKLDCCEFDHFYQASWPDAEHSWPLHKICHAELTQGIVHRNDRQSAFNAYQNARKRLPGRTPTLFG